MKECYASFLGHLGYAEALAIQVELCEKKKKSPLNPDLLLLLEHPPTITLGRNGKWKNLMVSDRTLRSRGVSCFEVDRGGDITFHGPGQLVGYPILKLENWERDVHRFMRNMEEVLVRTMEVYGIRAARREGYTGVWTESGKIAAMGVHFSRWVTRHGFALNVSTDLSYFDLIVPCGIAGGSVTSMESLLPEAPTLEEIAQSLVPVFGEVFHRRMVAVTASEFKDKLELSQCMSPIK